MVKTLFYLKLIKQEYYYPLPIFKSNADSRLPHINIPIPDHHVYNMRMKHQYMFQAALQLPVHTHK
ncbi:hypothetical protein BGI30_06970 [Snodgrassella alvi]|uniref:Uncharacterized protein n=1 Tax=Snodgrassella alvi TaxID=1196083 RepID=A0A855FWR6_9NEIS|nr:hypothetical protein BGI30_06970 [Snodgrassella alvi]PIT23826.1 hypothetical protein BGI37_11800 [Snodgrassella alvi]PIT43183.1 hypothetical protein BHC51_12015 [Snodgrassella alvi]PIT57339.1 hypothetical protein BHC59_05460 [Snodgrassella alvi]PIT58527.1 hypothetical protein BHC57_11820 [Snodgrassella alvi]